MKDKVASLYIHIPFCEQRCAYCDFFSTVSQNSDLYVPYVHSLMEDIAFFKAFYSIATFRTVYIGGGTPSLLPLPLLKKLSIFIRSSQRQEIEEFTIEANPQDITHEHLYIWQECGINRLSIGIQSLQDEVLKMEKRRGSRNESIVALELVSKEWKGILSLDFIAGLKGQTCKNLLSDLKFALQFAPHHISLYELVPHYQDDAFSAEVCEERNEEESKETLWECGRQLLKNSNYSQYEVSNFSYNGAFECSHNKAYWKMYDYVGVGVGAVGNMRVEDGMSEVREWEVEDMKSSTSAYVSHLKEARRRLKAIRSVGIQNVASYIEKENRKEAYEWEEVQGCDLLKDAMLMGFRLIEGIDDAEFRNNFATSLFELIPKTIAKWKTKHLACIEFGDPSLQENRYVKLTKKGMMLLNTFLCEAFEELEHRVKR